MDNNRSFDLPNANYVKRWEACTSVPNLFRREFLGAKPYTRISLESFICKGAFFDNEAMKKLLDSKKIQISEVRRYTNDYGGTGIVFKGSSFEVGSYTLTLVKSRDGLEEGIYLESRRNDSTDYGEMQKLVDCVREYLNLYEKYKEERRDEMQLSHNPDTGGLSK